MSISRLALGLWRRSRPFRILTIAVGMTGLTLLSGQVPRGGQAPSQAGSTQSSAGGGCGAGTRREHQGGEPPPQFPRTAVLPGPVCRRPW